MSKITDQDYYLPHIVAKGKSQNFNSGTTKPMLIFGKCNETGEEDFYVAKFIKSERMSIESSCRELVAALIAKELDLNTVEPVIIDIDKFFVETLQDSNDNSNYNKGDYLIASESIGSNFGSLYIKGCSTYIKNQNLNDILLAQAENIFAFDIFISNVDRRIDKPNLLINGNKIIVLDHELSFSFVNTIGPRNKTPWIFSQNDLSWIRNHCLYNNLRGGNIKFNNFIYKINNINTNFWNILNVLIPKDWKENSMKQIEEIKATLDSIIQHKFIFLEELKRVIL